MGPEISEIRSFTRTVVVLTVVLATIGLGVPGGTTPVGVASAATPINSCTTISSPGTYELQTDITNSAANTCILINSSDVHLDGNGHTIDGIDDIGSAGIYVEGSGTLTNVTVTNVTVTDWDRAIYARDIFNGIISETTLTDNIQASTLGAMSVLEGTGVTVIDNNASFNQGFGIVVDGVENVVDSNLATDNAGGINNGTGGGILVSGNHSRVLENVVRDNERVGLELELLYNSTVTHNRASGNGDLGPGFPRYGYNGGIVFLTAEDNEVTRNNASGNEVGIRLRSADRLGPVTDNNFSNNTATNNDAWDVISTNGTVGNSHNDLFIGDSVVPTTITFEASKDIALRHVTSPPPDPPGKQNIGHYVNGTNTSDDSFVFLNVSYQQSDVTSAGVAESTLRMWRYLTSWSKVAGTNGVNTADNYVFANVTTFPAPPEVFAPLGNVSEGTETPTATPEPTPTETAEPTETREPTPTETRTRTPTDGKPTALYPAKFVCGQISERRVGDTAGEEPPVKPGNYATAINVHNFQNEDVTLWIRPSFATIDRGSGFTGSVVTRTLEPHESIEIDCREIAEFGGRETAAAQFLKGFVTLRSSAEIQVTGVYTSKDEEPGTGISIDVEEVEAHDIKNTGASDSGMRQGAISLAGLLIGGLLFGAAVFRAFGRLG